MNISIPFDEKEIARTLPNYPEVLGRRVVAVFQVSSMLCCQLDGDFVIAAHFAIEHQDLEVILGKCRDLPPEFSAIHYRLPHAMQFALLGRRFRGLVSLPNADVLLNFGRYGIKFVRSTGLAHLVIGTNNSKCWDLPEDPHLSNHEQLIRAQKLAGQSFM